MGYEDVVGPLLFIIYFLADYVDGIASCLSFTESAKELQEREI